MTLKEVQLVIECDNEMKKQELEVKKHQIYDDSYLTALFVGCILNGKTIPSFSEIFPDTKSDTKSVTSTLDNNTLMIKEKLLDFANKANKRRK